MAKKAVKKAAKRAVKKAVKRPRPKRDLSIQIYGVLRINPWGGESLSPYTFGSRKEAQDYAQFLQSNVTRAKAVKLIARTV